MVLIIINRKLLKASVIILLAISLCVNIYNHYHSMELTNKYESLVCLSNQFYQTSLIAFLASAQELDTPNKPIEIFDITKGEVIKKVHSTRVIQNEAISYLNGISSMYIKVKAFPEKGYIVRIPITPSVQVKNHWLNDYNINSVDEVFILLPEQGNTYLLVLDNKLRPYFYNFIGNVDVLLKNLEFFPVPT
ncbi:hypothetical protein [Acetivibrio cellulolyticus]|uniref:hypothetical protein n=1 Tax=Acetivibrio cellulolyticus TaxID=35830 RepID=UPI0001E2D073|nr:hypothetical protein [Acetivibrio cellulolyticus]